MRVRERREGVVEGEEGKGNYGKKEKREGAGQRGRREGTRGKKA